MLGNSSFSLNRFLLKLAIETTQPPLTKPVGVVPVEDYLAEMGFRRLGWRAVRRKLIFLASGQAKYKRNAIEKPWKRGLWLYFGEGQMGDALMDLAPRSLLQRSGLRMDLLTEKSISEIFQGDPWFERITDNAAQLVDTPYDFALVLSNKRRSLQTKRKYFTKLPWVSILENFSGPDFHRSGFATQRLADLLGIELSTSDFAFHARQKLKPILAITELPAQAPDLKHSIALCIGGVDPLRTYQFWDAVIEALIRTGKTEFLLVGSQNGVAEAGRLQDKFVQAARFHDYTGKMTIQQTRALLAAARVVACTDGGLMHLAATTETPMLALFSSTIHPDWRLPARDSVAALSSSSANISDIPPRAIAAKIVSFYESVRQ